MSFNSLTRKVDSASSTYRFSSHLWLRNLRRMRTCTFFIPEPWPFGHFQTIFLVNLDLNWTSSRETYFEDFRGQARLEGYDPATHFSLLSLSVFNSITLSNALSHSQRRPFSLSITAKDEVKGVKGLKGLKLKFKDQNQIAYFINYVEMGL
ncbi:uncharacterized protein LOC126607292 [Malus sylvestris]|uniref:uncharacterized protein LOC126607292 n=1 Tax=Malus sylvestris TaxID=3752 RepID=UPI0021ABF862|nr:uncharacterized protein LOC126607292 [Malus sylvestris]